MDSKRNIVSIEAGAARAVTRSGRAGSDLLHGGTIFHVTGLTAAMELAAAARRFLENEYPARSSETLHDPALPFTEVQSLRRRIRESSEFRERAVAVLTAFGLPRDGAYLDAVRLRMTMPGDRPETAATRYIHRDTWYANPGCQWNWWIPLYPVTRERSFALYPTYFDQPIANDSARFRYDEWMAGGGFQSGRPAGQHFPRALAVPAASTAVVPELDAGEVLIFAAAQLHGTLINTSDRTRWTLELRTVLDDDLRNLRTAPNCDNASTGTVLRHMYRLDDGSVPPEEVVERYTAFTAGPGASPSFAGRARWDGRSE